MVKSNLLLFLGALFFWSATWSVIGLTQVNIDLDPTISVFIRFIIAGLIILKEAGGHYKLKKLKEINNTKVSLVASNKYLFQKIKRLLKI